MTDRPEPSVYVASSLQNYEQVLSFQVRFRALQKIISFDWASLWKEQLAGAEVDKARLAAQMLDGVKRADVLLLVLPAKRGAHVEFGAAAVLGKPCVVLNPSPSEDISFYQLPNVQITRDPGVAFRAVLKLLEAVL
jgi:nucleoside 2-deoxyribosyltransferase